MLPLADAASVENLRRNSRPVPGQHIAAVLSAVSRAHGQADMPFAALRLRRGGKGGNEQAAQDKTAELFFCMKGLADRGGMLPEDSAASGTQGLHGPAFPLISAGTVR